MRQEDKLPRSNTTLSDTLHRLVAACDVQGKKEAAKWRKELQRRKPKQ